jgi:hypothetical protein
MPEEKKTAADIPPELFGFDPDETWEYTPIGYRSLPKEKRLVLTLKAPDVALDQLMEAEESEMRRAVRAAVPEAVATMNRLRIVAQKARAAALLNAQDDEAKAEIEERTIPAMLNDEQRDEYAKAVEAWAGAAMAYDEKREDRFAVMRRVLGACVASWTGLVTPKGKAVPRPENDADVLERLPKPVRAEVYNVLREGSRPTEEVMESLR